MQIRPKQSPVEIFARRRSECEVESGIRSLTGACLGFFTSLRVQDSGLGNESSSIKRSAADDKFAVCRRPKDHHLTSRGLVDLNVAVSIKPSLICIRETGLRNDF